MPKLRVQAGAGVGGRLPRHSDHGARGNAPQGSSARDKSTVKRLHMYRTKSVKRDRKGKVIEGAGDLTSKTPELGAGRTAPNRKWFGNTRTVDQKDLERFREKMGEVKTDPYSVIMKKRKVPMGLLSDGTPGRELQGEKLGLLATQSFEETFSGKRWRKRPKLDASDGLEQLLARATQKNAEYEQKNEPEPHTVPAEGEDGSVAATAGPVFDDFQNVDKDRVFDKGQSRRIWGELHKVVDSSDVILQVIDARDPMGTRCTWLEKFVARECPHKHIVLILNKCDLVPTWVTTRWIKVLSREFPTLAFHSSITNPFGKGSLINLLRQFKKLHNDRKSISVGMVGYPNVGKSSVINTLSGKKVVNVAPVPGETKVWQYITLFKAIFLVDCPGVVHGSESDSTTDAVLKGVVRVESLKDTAPQYIEALLERVEKEHVGRTYGVYSWTDSDDFLEQLARRTGKLLPKGVPDVAISARRVILDFQRGKLPWFVPPPDGFDTEDISGQAEMPAGIAVPEQALDGVRSKMLAVENEVENDD